MQETTVSRPSAGGSYIRDKDGSIRPASAREPVAAAAKPASEVPANQTGAPPKKRK